MATDSTNTGLVIAAAPLDPAFRGDPQKFADHLVERLRIVAPFGLSTFTTGNVMPTSNKGPWLRAGTQWWVYDETLATYVPLDISESESAPYIISATQPTDGTVPVWFQMSADYRRVLQVYVYAPTSLTGLTADRWQPLLALIQSGPTADRPGGASVEFQEYYDTDIKVLLWWERGAWRTKDGVIGDIKQVAWATLADALAHNPGWKEIGEQNQAWRGRVLGTAAKDSVASGGTENRVVDAGIVARDAGATVGKESLDYYLNMRLVGAAVGATVAVANFTIATALEDPAVLTEVPPAFTHTYPYTVNRMQPTSFFWTLVKE